MTIFNGGHEAVDADIKLLREKMKQENKMKELSENTIQRIYSTIASLRAGHKSKRKIWCRECEWGGYSDEVLTAPNPYLPDEEIIFCPRCKSTGSDELFNHDRCYSKNCFKEGLQYFGRGVFIVRLCDEHRQEVLDRVNADIRDEVGGE